MLVRKAVLGCALLMAACSSNHATTASSQRSTRPEVEAGAAGPALPPLAGASQATFQMDTFDLESGGEVYKCQDFPNTFGKDIAILQSLSVMTVGSHHMFAFRLGPNDSPLNLSDAGTKGPLVDCPAGGVEFHAYFHDAQIPRRLVEYPKGVGRSLKSTEGVRLMVHYLNSSDHILHPTVGVTLNYVDAGAVDALAAEYFLNAVGINVPPGKSTQTFAYTFPSDVQVLSAVSHMHRHGYHFEADMLEPGDGGDAGSSTPLYASDDWEAPQPLDFDPPKQVRAGDTFRFSCSYQNDGTEPFTFGESAMKNEMCIFQGTFYPTKDGTGIVPLIFSTAK